MAADACGLRFRGHDRQQPSPLTEQGFVLADLDDKQTASLQAGPGTEAKDQKPINVRPEILVVPVEVETEVELLMGSSQILLDGARGGTFGCKSLSL